MKPINRFMVMMVTVLSIFLAIPVYSAQDASVLQVQKKLGDLGYDPGPLDGILGQQTRRAIRAYQRDNSLEITGTLDNETIRSLGVEASRRTEVFQRETKKNKIENQELENVLIETLRTQGVRDRFVIRDIEILAGRGSYRMSMRSAKKFTRTLCESGKMESQGSWVISGVKREAGTNGPIVFTDYPDDQIPLFDDFSRSVAYCKGSLPKDFPVEFLNAYVHCIDGSIWRIYGQVPNVFGYTITGKEDDPMVFYLMQGIGVVYLHGEGNVKDKDGMVVFDTRARTRISDSAIAGSLFNAALKGDIDQAKQLITQGADINAEENKYGATALIIAADQGHEYFVKFLLSMRPDVNAKENKFGSTALIAASQKGYDEIIKALLSNNADVNVKANDGRTALHMASKQGYVDIVNSLLLSGADVNVKANNGATALHKASQEGHVEIVNALLLNGADVNLKDDDGWTALYMASAQGHVDIIVALLSNEANINVKTNTGATALFIATQEGHDIVVNALLSNGADVDAKENEYGVTPLFMASQKGHTEIVKALLLKNANIEMKTKGGNTALIIASKKGFSDIVKALLSKNAEVNVKTVDGKTALYYAIKNDHKEIVEMLKNADGK